VPSAPFSGTDQLSAQSLIDVLACFVCVRCAQLLRKLAQDVRFNGLVIMITPLDRDPYDTDRVSNQRPVNGFKPLRDYVAVDDHIIDNKLMDLVRGYANAWG
jgi:hypothetical protein